MHHDFSASVFAIAKSICFVASAARNYGSRAPSLLLNSLRWEASAARCAVKSVYCFQSDRCIALVSGKQAVLLLCPVECHCYILYLNLMTWADIFLPCGCFYSLIKPNSGINPPFSSPHLSPLCPSLLSWRKTSVYFTPFPWIKPSECRRLSQGFRLFHAH